MQVVRLNDSDRDTLVASIEEFRKLKKWIKTTPLYDTILKDSGTPIDELPVELIIEFYNNWPDKNLYEVTCEEPSPKQVLQEAVLDQKREDMLVSALEGGSNYWYWINDESYEIIEAFNRDNDTPFSIAMWLAIKGGKSIKIHDIENKKELLGEINLTSIRKGEELMLREQPKHFADIISESDDATTADVWFQYCVMGKIVYG